MFCPFTDQRFQVILKPRQTISFMGPEACTLVPDASTTPRRFRGCARAGTVSDQVSEQEPRALLLPDRNRAYSSPYMRGDLFPAAAIPPSLGRESPRFGPLAGCRRTPSTVALIPLFAFA